MASQPSNLEETFLTVAEVAEMLKLNQQTVRNWIDQGRLPALRVGRRVRIRGSDLERVLEEASIAVAGAPNATAAPTAASPSAEDFWGGEPIGMLEPDVASLDAGTRLPSPDGAEARSEIAANGGMKAP